jgi:hydroxymethylpyrimidine pyrophosphatase-like HAD family hydrolase
MHIQWNRQVKLILSDVDETVADLYMPAEPQMITQFTKLLSEGKVIFFITGQGLESVQGRIVHFIPQMLRSKILIGHCSGAEVVGFESNGEMRREPFYSIYERTLTPAKQHTWRNIVEQIIAEFKLLVYPTMPIKEFVTESGANPLAIMFEDRGPQITFEVVNGYDLTPDQVKSLELTIPKTHGHYDIRIPIVERADQLFIQAKLPITSRLGGEFAIDFAVRGVSKTTAVKYVLENEHVLSSVGLTALDVTHPESVEIWGDKFSVIRGGTDRHMSEAVDKRVRSIDFRQENPAEFPEGYTIVVWDGKKHLHNGLLEFLLQRT